MPCDTALLPSVPVSVVRYFVKDHYFYAGRRAHGQDSALLQRSEVPIRVMSIGLAFIVVCWYSQWFTVVTW